MVGEGEALAEFGVSIVVIKARPQSPLKIGQHYDVRSFPIVLGRSLDAGVRIADNTVSREHARLELVDGRLELVALSTASNVWVNQTLLTVGQRVILDPSQALVQLGGVLLRIDSSEPTTPFQETLQAPSLPNQRGLLHISVGSEGMHVELGGHDVQLHRGPANVLLAMARQPNTVLAEETLLLFGESSVERALERNLNQLVTYIRNALRSAIQHDVAIRQRVLEAMRKAEMQRGEEILSDFDISDDSLARRLIKNHRRFGFSLRLPSESVTIVESTIADFPVEGTGAYEL